MHIPNDLNYSLFRGNIPLLCYYYITYTKKQKKVSDWIRTSVSYHTGTTALPTEVQIVSPNATNVLLRLMLLYFLFYYIACQNNFIL